MNFSSKHSLILLLILGTISCKKSTYDTKITDNTDYIHNSVRKTTEIIVHDIFSPVVAGRIYAYSSIALYETLRQGNAKYKSFAGQLHGLTEVPAPPKDEKIDLNLAALHAYMTVSKAMIFSENEMEDYRDTMYAEFKAKGVPEEVFNASLAYGKTVADHILAWSKKDNYAQTRSFPKYTPNTDPARWQPTPPAYIEAIEPNWNKIRPMVMDSANQFAPAPPTPYNADKNSQFYKEAYQVYMVDSTDTENKLAIANFWDCNPYVMHQQGHMMFATKKITPGGHWMGIVGLATRKSKCDMVATAEAYALVAIGLFDGFISCWDEKYRTNLVRPETYINRQINQNWRPTLQTPPFPEYTSGHSVISSSSQVILTHLFGDNFAFEDSTELDYNLPVRSFKSFKDAASEAAVSRNYGGIHYMPAIENGILQGTKIGELIWSKVRTR
jgi:hypothetical protein